MEVLSWIIYLGGPLLFALLILIAFVDRATRERPRTPPAPAPYQDEPDLIDLDPEWVREELDEVDQDLILGPE